MRTRVGILLAACLLLPLVAFAEGQTVGPTCTLSWTAPTTNTDGTPITNPIRWYNVWITNTLTPAPTIATPRTASVTAPATSWNCAGISVGQHYAWVSVNVETQGDSAVSTPLPFVYQSTAPAPPKVPAAPTGLKVAP